MLPAGPRRMFSKPWTQLWSIIQDAGARFYTYETTLGYFLEGAAKAGIELIVLDRPNPVTGSFVQGTDPRCRTRKLRELFSCSRPPWHDHGRAGEDVQR